jgi:hypothetical protein
MRPKPMRYGGVSGVDRLGCDAIFFPARQHRAGLLVVVVAQSVRAPDCGSGGCGFKSRQPPWQGGSAARSGAKVRSSIGRAPVSKTGGWGFDSLRACRENLALSSRGLGRGPLKAQTRVRIPLALSPNGEVGPIVYRSGRDPFKVERRVRFPLGLRRELRRSLGPRASSSIGRARDS